MFKNTFEGGAFPYPIILAVFGLSPRFPFILIFVLKLLSALLKNKNAIIDSSW